MSVLPGYGYGDGDDFPVYFVSWFFAIEYCNRRSIAEALPPCYSYSTYGTNPDNWPADWKFYDSNQNNVVCDWNATGYRLPTEAEWEFGARGGNLTNNYTYSGSNDVNTVAWTPGNAGGCSHQVGNKAPNELGIYDMSGNVREWCWDGAFDYWTEAQTNPHGRGPVNPYRMFRGGGWWYGVGTISNRSYLSPTGSNRDIGFRICRRCSDLVVSTPVFVPLPGAYSGQQTVTIRCSTEGAEIRYTLDGSEPDQSSPVYTNSVPVTINSTLKARAFKPGAISSDMKSGTYTLAASAENMILVDGGSLRDGFSTEVLLSSFLIDKYEVTQLDYLTIMGSLPSTSYGYGSNYPVYRVYWYKAIQYCNRLSIAEGLTPVYTYSSLGTDPSNWPDYLDANLLSVNWIANGYRLPTSLEWEYAVKGGRLSQGYLYSGSNTLSNVAWWSSNSGYHSRVVGTKAPNELGLYDMSGNVREWCWDRIWGDPPTDVTWINPTGISTGDYRTLRGGGWEDDQYACWVETTIEYMYYFTYNYMGFRVCRSVP